MNTRRKITFGGSVIAVLLVSAMALYAQAQAHRLIRFGKLLLFSLATGLVLVLAAALDLAAGEQVQWQLLGRSDLRLKRLAPPPASPKSKK